MTDALSPEQRQRKHDDLVKQLTEAVQELIDSKYNYARGITPTYTPPAYIDSMHVRQLAQEILELGVAKSLPLHLREYVWQVLLGCYNKDASHIDEWIHKHRLKAEELVPDLSADTGMEEDTPASPTSGKINFFSFRKSGLPEFSSSNDSSEDADPILVKAERTDWLKTLRADMPRTRTDSTLFLRRFKVQADLELILTFYCITRGVAYKQGLNELLAPFLALRIMTGELDAKNGIDPERFSWGPIFLSFYHFITKFFPSIYDDEEFESLQCIFRLFQLLLQYHEPGLANFLEQYQLIPELYAIPWFITLFARQLDLDLVYALWDRCIVYEDPYLHFMMAASIMIENRQALMETDPGSLPSTLSSIQKYLKNMEMLETVINQALSLRNKTPISFQKDLHEISVNLNKKALKDRIKKLSQAYKSLPCLAVPPQEIVSQCYNQIPEDKSLKYILLDCRRADEYNAGHLPCTIHFDPTWLGQPDVLTEKLGELWSLKGCHVCFIGAGDSEEDPIGRVGFSPEEELVVCLILQFLQKSFQYISWCKAGYTKCHKVVSELANCDLVDHKKAQCVVCNPSVTPSASKRSTSALLQASKSSIMSSVSKIKNSWSYFSANVVSEFKDLVDVSEPPSVSPALSPMNSNDPRGRPAGRTPSMSRSNSEKKVIAIPKIEEKQVKKVEKIQPSEDDLPVLDLTEWQETGEFTFFRCLEILSPSEKSEESKPITKQRILAVSKGYVIVLDPVPKPSDGSSSGGKQVRLVDKYQIRYLCKVSSKNPKKVDGSTEEKPGPKYVTFYFKDRDKMLSSGNSNPPAVVSNLDVGTEADVPMLKKTFLVTDARECIDLVKQYYSVFNPFI